MNILFILLLRYLCFFLQAPDFDVTPLLCQTSGLYRYTNNAQALVATPLLELTGTKMSSIITNIEMDHTIAFIGTSSGTFLKVRPDAHECTLNAYCLPSRIHFLLYNITCFCYKSFSIP